jgi:hypothetical protein
VERNSASTTTAITSASGMSNASSAKRSPQAQRPSPQDSPRHANHALRGLHRRGRRPYYPQACRQAAVWASTAIGLPPPARESSAPSLPLFCERVGLMQLLAADDFTYNSHALRYLRGEVSISMKARNLQIGGGVGPTTPHTVRKDSSQSRCRWCP